MAYKIIEIDDTFIRLRISGLIRLADHEAMQALAKEMIDQGKKVRILAVIDDFQGWERNSKWDDVGFLMEYGDEIEKIAIVAEERWKEPAFLFVGKGFRTTEIEYFRPSELPEAEQWVSR